MDKIYDSQIKAFKSITGPIKRGSSVNIEVHIPKEENPVKLFVLGGKLGTKEFHMLPS